MLGSSEDLVDAAGLDDAAAVHDDDPVADPGDDGEVVSDEQQSRLHRRDPFGDEVEHMLLHGDVEGSGGFVADEQPRRVGQGDRKHDPLPLSARHLVRVGETGTVRVGHVDVVEQFAHPRRDLCTGNLAVDAQHFGDLVADAHERVEGAHGFLEHHRHDLRTQPGQGLLVRFEEVPGMPLQAHLPPSMQLFGQQTHHGLRSQGLSRPGFADEPDPLPRRQTEADIVEHRCLRSGGGDGEVTNLEQILRHLGPPSSGRTGHAAHRPRG